MRPQLHRSVLEGKGQFASKAQSQDRSLCFDSGPRALGAAVIFGFISFLKNMIFEMRTNQTNSSSSQNQVVPLFFLCDIKVVPNHSEGIPIGLVFDPQN